MIPNNLVLVCFVGILIWYFTENLVKNAVEERVDEQTNPCPDYEPRHPIPTRSSDPIPNIKVLPLAAIGLTAASIFGAPAILGALGFKAAGIAAGSVAAWVQSMLYAGAVPAGSWFALFQGAAMTGAVITKGTAFTIGTISGATFYWYALDKVPKSEEEWREMNKKCEDCVINRLGCQPAKVRLFEHLEHEKSQIGWFSSIEKEKLTADENWESFVRLSCECFPVFKNKQQEGEGPHEKELASLFHHYVPYFYTTNA